MTIIAYLLIIKSEFFSLEFKNLSNIVPIYISVPTSCYFSLDAPKETTSFENRFGKLIELTAL